MVWRAFRLLVGSIVRSFRLAREPYKRMQLSLDFERKEPSNCGAPPRSCISWSRISDNNSSFSNNRLTHIIHSSPCHSFTAKTIKNVCFSASLAPLPHFLKLRTTPKGLLREIDIEIKLCHCIAHKSLERQCVIMNKNLHCPPCAFHYTFVTYYFVVGGNCAVAYVDFLC